MRLKAVILFGVVFLAAMVQHGCKTAAGADALKWRIDDFNTEMHPIGSLRAVATASNGVLHVVDTGTQSGDMVVLNQHWSVCPTLGATVETRVRVVACQGMAGVMLGFSNGLHEDILTLYTDKIELNHAKLAYAMDTTDNFHVYHVLVLRDDGDGFDLVLCGQSSCRTRRL